MQNSRNLRFQITKVWAKNFRSIADASVDLDELTVLVGPNASGKSNVLDILRFVKDALRFDLEAAVSMRHGIDAIHRQKSGTTPPSIEIGISATTADYLIEYGFVLAIDSDGGYVVSREYGKVWEGDGSDEAIVEFTIKDGNLVSPEFLRNSRSRARQDDEDTDFDVFDLSLRRMSRTWLLRGFDDYAKNEDTIRLMSRALERLYRGIINMRFYHIFPNTIREPQKLGNAYPLDEDAGNLASVLRDLEKKRPLVMKRLKESLRRLIPGVLDLEIASAGGYLVVRLEHDSVQGGTWFDLSQESDGTIRLLGLLVAVYQFRPLSLIGIEEPELTVHPGVLAVLADVLNESALRSQIIVTTHSPDLIDSVTDYRAIENLRIVGIVDGVTAIGEVASPQVEAVKRHLFSPGELHRMDELELVNKANGE